MLWRTEFRIGTPTLVRLCRGWKSDLPGAHPVFSVTYFKWLYSRKILDTVMKPFQAYFLGTPCWTSSIGCLAHLLVEMCSLTPGRWFRTRDLCASLPAGVSTLSSIAPFYLPCLSPPSSFSSSMSLGISISSGLSAWLGQSGSAAAVWSHPSESAYSQFQCSIAWVRGSDALMPQGCIENSCSSLAREGGGEGRSSRASRWKVGAIGWRTVFSSGETSSASPLKNPETLSGRLQRAALKRLTTWSDVKELLPVC